MVANVSFLIYAYGNVVYSGEGASYDRQPVRKIRVKTDTSYKDLLNTICTKIETDTSAHQIKVFHRHPESVGGRVRYTSVPILDDDDVEVLIEMAEKMGEGSIQALYIETCNRSIGLSENETRQVDASTAQAPRSKRDPISEIENSMHKRARYNIGPSEDINNIEQEINRAPEDPPTETGKNLVVADSRNEDPSQNLTIYKSCNPTAFAMPPSPMLMDITNGMAEGNQTSRASSSTTPPPGKNYEVFLSFRGEDTRHGFIDHFYNGLVNVGVWAFRDNEELHVGEKIGPELLKAIRGSRISIPVISKNYASSRWCLKELVQILECMKTSGQIVLPIFYRVTPSEVGNQTGDFGSGFLQCKKKHDVEGRFSQEWKDALMEVTTLKGWESSQIANGHEAELLQIVVNEVLEVLKKKTLPVSAHLIGVESHVEKIIERTKNVEGSSDVQAIIVHGMGGIGKTTLAKVVYNQLYVHFERCSFIANIRETSQQYKGKENLQKQLISNISGQRIDIQNIDEGAEIIKARCVGKKVLIVLDDVGHKDQVNALAGEPNWFGRGSIIIITSRNMDVIEKWKSTFFYELDSLDRDQSCLLFKKHAFKENDSCLDRHGTSAEDIFSATGGLPLAIEIVGSSLHGKKKDIWEDTLKMLKGIPHDDVQKKLKISFDALHPDEKEIFLDIACLPIRKDRELAIYMWEHCKFSKQRLNNLVSMSMIKYGEKSNLLIHDQLRDLGREIVRQENVYNPGNRSRIWEEKDAWQVLHSMQGTPNVQALRFGCRGKEAHCTSQQFEGMNGLRFLHMEHVWLTGNFENIFLNLQWLRWNCFWSGCSDIVGINFKPKRLVVLQLYRCNVTEHWTGWSEMKYLKVLELIRCHGLSKTPDFSAVEELDVLVLRDCGKLREIHSSIGKFSKSLKVLVVVACHQLKELPKEVGKMEKLRELDLSYTHITQLPPSIGDLRGLRRLSMSGSDIKYLPTSIGKLNELRQLDLRGCSSLKRIPKSIGKLKSLTKLVLSFTKVTQLPPLIGDLRGLRRLSISGSHIKYLPTSIGKLNELQKLDLWGCSSFKRIPKSIGKLKSLTELNLTSTKVTQLPRSIGDLRGLRRLSMNRSCIKCLPTSIGKLNELQQLDLGGCSSLKRIPKPIGKLKSLTMLNLRETGVKFLPTSIAKLTKLRQLYLEGCKELESLPNLPCSLAFLSFNGDSMETLPDSSNLTNLELLTYKDSFQRRSRELNLGKLNQLKYLDIRDSKEGIDMAPEDFCLLLELPLSVERLQIIGCHTLYTLPNFSTLENLFTLHLRKCSKLQEINGLAGAKSLLNVRISGCHPEIKIPDLTMLRNLKNLTINNDRLVEIPGLQELNSLEYLNISGCKSLKYLPDLSHLANLRYLDMRCCTELTMMLDLPNVHILSGPLESEEEVESDSNTFEEEEESENDSNPHEDDA